MTDIASNALRFKSRNTRLSILPTDNDGATSDFYDENLSTPKNTIPKMELLKINYIKKAAKPKSLCQNYHDSSAIELRSRDPLYHPIQISRPRSEGAINFLPKFTTDNNRKSFNPLKYAVYKKHNNNNNNRNVDARDIRLQYCNNDNHNNDEPLVLAKHNKIRRKYFIFDTGRKKSNNFETIQFYFDSKSYERHVDNKMYGILGDDNNIDVKSNTAEKRTNKIPASLEGKDTKATWSLKKIYREKSHTKLTDIKSKNDDLSKIDKIFENSNRTKYLNDTNHVISNDQTAGSLKKVKKLVDSNFENRCTCDHIENIIGEQTDSKRQHHQQILFSNQHNVLPQHINLNSNNNARKQQQFISQQTDAIMPKIYAKQHCNDNGSDENNICTASTDLEKSTNISSNFPKHQQSFKSNNINAYSVSSSPPPVQNTCGYKNCTFLNCPMSTTSSSGDDFNQPLKQSKIIQSELKLNKITAITNIDDDNHQYQSKKNKFIDDTLIVPHKTVSNNNMKNIQKTIVDLKFSENNQNFNNSIKLKNVDKLNFNSKTNCSNSNKINKNAIAQPSVTTVVKMRNNKTGILASKVRFTNNRPASLSESSSSTGSEHYEIVSDNSKKSSEIASNTKNFVQHIRSMFPTKFGCDGAIFWNDCYYYDEHACCNCRLPSSAETNNDDNENNISKCVCDEKKVKHNILFKLKKSYVIRNK